eukprot:5360050-Amphidinium_carterae.1
MGPRTQPTVDGRIVGNATRGKACELAESTKAAAEGVQQTKAGSLSLRDQRASLFSRAKQLAEKVDRHCEAVDKAIAERDLACNELYEVQEKLRALPEEPVPEPVKTVSQAGPAPAELKLLLAYVQAKASESCGDANGFAVCCSTACRMEGTREAGSGNPTLGARRRLPGQAGSFCRYPCGGVDPGRAGRLLQAPGEWTPVGPGGSCKRRAQPTCYH